MRTLIKLTFALALIAVSSADIVAQQNSDLVGSYLFRFQFGGSQIDLRKNATYTESSGDCTGVTIESGRYSVSNNVIRFTPRKLIRRDNGNHKEHDLTKRKNRKKYLDTDKPFKPESWELQVVKWDERVYLIHRESFGSFIAAINLGFEPRKVDGYRAYYSSIYLREGDESKPVTGPPPLPEEFLRELLPAPLVATVLEIKTEGEEAIAIIDRGTADGLRQNLRLVRNNPRALDFSSYEIISISEHSARVRVYGDIKVGDQLSTRVSDVLLYAE